MLHKVYFRFYEELNDFLPEEKRKTKFEHSFVDKASVKDMIESLGVPHTEIDLILVNGSSVDFNYKVNYDDEISVYPVFESFDISGVQHLRPGPLRTPKFIADVHLGKLTKYLRMLGIDVFYRNNLTGDEIVEISLNEKRAVLTRSRDLLKRNEITHGYWIRNSELENQLSEVIERFHLQNEIKEFSRCLTCNAPLKEEKKEEILNKIPEKVKKYFSEYKSCPVCRKIFWKGSHFDNMKKTTDKLKYN